MDRCTIISNHGKGVYFLATHHCQDTRHLGEGWVPITFYLPQLVVPRPNLPGGVVKTIDDVKTIFFNGMEEIPNPK